jgi:hypothetical protein
MSPAQVLFDEAHSEAWTIRPELARAMQPAHPGDASYARAAELLGSRDFSVAANTDGPLTPDALADIDVLVIAHPSDPKWERTTGTGRPLLSAQELDAVEGYVRAGGGLIILGETEQDKYGNNLNELLSRFGLRLTNDTVQDYEHHAGAPSWILGELGQGGRGNDGDLLARVEQICFYRSTTIASDNGARVLARTHATASVPGAPLLVAAEHGGGRVVVLADSDLFGDDCIDQLDHADLWLNLAYWATGGRTGGEPAAAGELPDGWAELRDETNALALLQEPKGELKPAADREAASAHVDAILGALERMAPHFPHQAEYFQMAAADLCSWRESGYGKPDFTRALAAFRPDLHRVNGLHSLAFFPMYKQNGSRDTCFEALIFDVPWPDWIAELERTRYDNAKYVPVALVAATHGYDSECAVLFPEMISTAERPVNNFGAIFCDRESARLRRIGGAAADLLRMNLPPDAARLLHDPEISQQAYILWDLIHDRNHSHGDLPFDPFMIRQRAPYWMYSLEELRCDLTTYVQAMALEREPDDIAPAHSGEAGRRAGGRAMSFARHVQYAILLDRLLRFPITGPRVRNYDGLGGQLLFAYLHSGGYLHWTDNQLTVEWERVGQGVAGLQHEISELYRAGIARTKLQHWAAAHDLISRWVPPASGSKWAAPVRDLAETEDPRPYCDLVLPDEFPLSIFYSSLKAKLMPEPPAKLA